MKDCNKCGTPISFEKLNNGKWRPINPDGSAHRCERNQGNGNGKAISDSPNFLGTILTRTDDKLVLKIGQYKLDIRKEET